MVTQNKRLFGIVLTVVGLLLIPLIAMQFTSEVDWDLGDFVIMGILLLGTGLMAELVIRKVKNTESRLVIVGLILLVFFLIWAELAVGIFGTPFAFDRQPRGGGNPGNASVFVMLSGAERDCRARARLRKVRRGGGWRGRSAAAAATIPWARPSG